jgi:hypothetical protein
MSSSSNNVNYVSVPLVAEPLDNTLQTFHIKLPESTVWSYDHNNMLCITLPEGHVLRFSSDSGPLSLPGQGSLDYTAFPTSYHTIDGGRVNISHILRKLLLVQHNSGGPKNNSLTTTPWSENDLDEAQHIIPRANPNGCYVPSCYIDV